MHVGISMLLLFIFSFRFLFASDPHTWRWWNSSMKVFQCYTVHCNRGLEGFIFERIDYDIAWSFFFLFFSLSLSICFLKIFFYKNEKNTYFSQNSCTQNIFKCVKYTKYSLYLCISKVKKNLVESKFIALRRTKKNQSNIVSA